MIFPTQLATIFAFIAVLYDCVSAATVTRNSQRGDLYRRQNPGRGAGCGRVRSNVQEAEFRGQCVCFNPNTVAIFGETPEVVS